MKDKPPDSVIMSDKNIVASMVNINGYMHEEGAAFFNHHIVTQNMQIKVGNNEYIWNLSNNSWENDNVLYSIDIDKMLNAKCKRDKCDHHKRYNFELSWDFMMIYNDWRYLVLKHNTSVKMLTLLRTQNV